MKLPSKVTSYSESTIVLFPAVLSILEKGDMSPQSLFSKIQSKVSDVREFIEILDCLYALNKVDLREGALHYVN